MKNEKQNRLSTSTTDALQKLAGFLAEQKSIVIAFSGGMDSSMLALAAQKFAPASYQAVFVNSEFISTEESGIAHTIAGKYDLNFRQIDLQLLEKQEIADNTNLRCYHCKKHIFTTIMAKAGKDRTICEGSVTDDETDYRPGKIAINELQISSPLLQCGFSKTMVVEVLKSWNANELVRAAQSCMATRIESGSRITTEKLQQIEKGEKILRENGLDYCRLRHHGNLARIEVCPADIHKALDIICLITPALNQLGFKHVSLDPSGYKKGSMNPSHSVDTV